MYTVVWVGMHGLLYTPLGACKYFFLARATIICGGIINNRTFWAFIFQNNDGALYSKISQEMGQSREKRPTVSQGFKTDRFTLKPSSLASVKVNYRKNAVGQVVKVPSPDTFDAGQRCQEMGQSREKPPTVSQGFKTDRFTLKPSSLASVKVNYRKNAVGQGVKVPSSHNLCCTAVTRNRRRKVIVLSFFFSHFYFILYYYKNKNTLQQL